MLNLEEIDNTIEELENGDTTFDTCIKLAALYTVRERLNKPVQTMVEGLPANEPDAVENELADILPHYQKYCTVKRNWQLGNADKEALVNEIQFVCKEIREFVQALYSGTETSEERHYIVGMCSYLADSFPN